MRRLLIVGCGAAKHAIAQPAKSLYVGPLFTSARRYAEQEIEVGHVLAWRILSAKYGLIAPEQVIEPYNVRLAGGPRDPAFDRLLAEQLGAWLRELGASSHPTRDPFCTLEVHAGEAYVAAVAWCAGDMATNTRISAPLAGLSLGHRLGWYKRATS